MVWTWVAWLVCAAMPSAARSSSDAPLGVTTPGTLRMLFLDMPMADARAAGNDLRLEVRWWTANDWSTPTTLERGGRTVRIQVDEQADVLALALRVPWTRLFDTPAEVEGRPFAARLSTTVELRLIEHWGGWADGLIEWWHDLLGVHNFERNRYPPNAVNIILLEPGGRTVLQMEKPRLALGDLVLRNQLLVAEGGESFDGSGRSRWGVSLRGDLKLPAGSQAGAGSSGRVDAGVGLAGTAELTSWLTGHAMVTAAVWSGLQDDFPLQPRNWHWSAEFSLTAHFSGITLILEDRLVSPLFEDGWSFVPTPEGGLTSSAANAMLRSHNQISWGVRWNHFTLWMFEDWTPGSNPAGRVHWFYDSNHPDAGMGITFETNL